MKVTGMSQPEDKAGAFVIGFCRKSGSSGPGIGCGIPPMIKPFLVLISQNRLPFVRAFYQ